MRSFDGLQPARSWYSVEGPEYDVVLSTRIRLSRNLVSYRYPHMLSRAESAELTSRIISTVGKWDTEHRYAFMELGALSDWDRERLAERSIIPARFLKLPDRPMFLRDDERVAITIGDVDHIRVHAVGAGLCPEELVQETDKAESGLDADMHFAVSMEWGYLSTDIHNLGTGMKVSALVHLHALKALEELDGIVEALDRNGVSLEGFTDGSRNTGLCILATQKSLGVSESELVRQLEGAVMQLVHYERDARSRLVSTRRLEIEDRVHRSAGTLKSARRVDADEALYALSWLRFGVSTGMVTDTDATTVTELLFRTQHAHVAATLGPDDDDDMEEGVLVQEQRAAIIRNELSPSGGT